jgi:hypothetical protein
VAWWSQGFAVRNGLQNVKLPKQFKRQKSLAATTTTHLPGGRGAELRIVDDKIHETFGYKERSVGQP